MEKAKKFIYESSVKKQIEEKVPEKRIENGEEVTITRTVKKVKLVKIAMLKPDRRTNKEAEIFYAKRLSAYLKEGLLPQSLVTKRYLNDGGPLSDGEQKLVDSLRERYVALQDEYFGMKSPLSAEDNSRRGEIILELNEINKTLRDLQSNYADIFSNTAEAKGTSDVIEWWILFLSYVDIDGKGYAPLFGEGDFDAKMKKLEELEDKDNPFINELIKKLSYFVSFWHTAGLDVGKDDFKSAEENYEKKVTQYFVEEPEEPAPAPVTETPVAAPVEPAPVTEQPKVT